MSGYFITGTDTGIGKTVAASWLMLAVDGEYWKPVQAGVEGETDTDAVQRMTGLEAARFHEPAYTLKASLSPHEAARREGIEIEMARLAPPAHRRPLIVEGAGGVLVPLNHRDLMADLMGRLGLPVILVARTSLGTINHTLLSLEALQNRGLEVAGVVLNGEPNPANREAIIAYGNVPVIGELPVFTQVTRTALSAVTPKLPAAA